MVAWVDLVVQGRSTDAVVGYPTQTGDGRPFARESNPQTIGAERGFDGTDLRFAPGA